MGRTVPGLLRAVAAEAASLVNPGSQEARERGCTCPRFVNYLVDHVFQEDAHSIALGCPVHDPKERE